jgi:hypothetical protein
MTFGGFRKDAFSVEGFVSAKKVITHQLLVVMAEEGLPVEVELVVGAAEGALAL